MNRQRLEELVREWRRQLVTRDLLFTQAAGLGAMAATLWNPAHFSWWLPVGCLAGMLALRLRLSRPWRLDAAAICRHLDRTQPILEESAALFLRPTGELTLLERLQRQRISQKLAAGRLEAEGRRLGRPPGPFLVPALACALAATGLMLGTAWHLVRQPALDQAAPGRTAATAGVIRPPSPIPPPTVAGNRFTLTPPVYTGHPPRAVDGLNAEIEEGGVVAWDLALRGDTVREVRLVAGSAVVPLALTDDGRWHGGTIPRDTTLFSLSGTLADGTTWNPPELFAVKVRQDQAPVIRITQPDQPRTEILPADPEQVALAVDVTDDYAVAEAHLVATVAKGSGEAVKFREQTLSFDAATPGEAGAANRRFTKTLDLAALGLEPGDELYFFVEARDNRPPEGNRARSETRFVVLKGPEEKTASTGRGVAGVNQIPPYFRSERQIIIDTEKLLADQSALPDADFRARGNNLGQDQALLRLRYGRFLGEDQEDSALTDHVETSTNPFQGKPPEQAAGPRAAASVAARFRQEHAEQDREGGGEDGAPHAPRDGTPLTAEQVRQPFVDTHDLHDKNTFFDQSTQGTMRDALDAMWEAEKFLRTARPREALAPEHQALEILKNLQQSDRAYVQHVGFEAPPLKVAERRLKGETDDMPARAGWPDDTRTDDPTAADLRIALAGPEQGGLALASEAADRVEAALTRAATGQPEVFLPGLQAWRQQRASRALSAEQGRELQSALLRLLPPARSLPTRSEEAAGNLAVPYYRALATPEVRP